MKIVGYALIAFSFVAGAYLAVEPPHVLPVEGPEAARVPWTWVLPLFAVGVLGVALARLGQRQESRHEGKLEAGIEDLQRSIASIVNNAVRLDEEKTSMHPNDVHGRIDELFRTDLTTFVDARETIGHVHGLTAYADVMNEFSAGERYLNRVWSASVDGYIDEIHDYLPRARHQFEETQRKLDALHS